MLYNQVGGVHNSGKMECLYTWKTEYTPGRGYEHQEESAQQEHVVHTRKKVGHKVWNNRRESSPARLKRRLRECDSEA